MATFGEYLVELGAYETGGAGQTTLRFGSAGYNDPSAPGYYKPRLRQPLSFRRDIFSQGRLSGAQTVNSGEIIFNNEDGGLDNIKLQYGLAGQACALLIGDPAGVYSGFTPLITGRVEQALLDEAKLAVTIKDRLQDLTQPIQPNKYAGTNVLPNGLEGVADLSGKPKPKVFGEVHNVSPPCVNTARLIYQVNDGAVFDVPAVYSAGLALTKGADYTSQSDMETTAPSAGQYRAWKAGGYFRLGSSSSGALTCDIQEGANDAARTAAQVAYRIVTGTGGIVTGDVVVADRTALDTANSAVVGIWIDTEATFAAVLDPVLGSVGAWYGFDRAGLFRMQRLAAPTTSSIILRQGGPTVDLKDSDINIVAYRFLPTNDPDKGVPTWQVSLSYDRNYTVQNGDGLDGAVTDARKTYLKAETRSVVSSDPTIKTPNPNAVQKQIATLLRDAAAAQAEAARLLAMFKVRRDFAEIDITMTTAVVQTLELGKTIMVYLPRFDYGSGRAMVITGMDYNAQRKVLTLAVWG